MPGSIGSGSVPVIPLAVEVEDVVGAVGEFAFDPWLEANARTAGLASSRSNNAQPSLRPVFLNMEVSFSNARVRWAETSDCPTQFRRIP